MPARSTMLDSKRELGPGRPAINYYDQANQLKARRADGCLTLANFSCCQDVLRRVNKTFSAFFARCKRGDKPGFPRYQRSAGNPPSSANVEVVVSCVA